MIRNRSSRIALLIAAGIVLAGLGVAAAVPVKDGNGAAGRSPEDIRAAGAWREFVAQRRRQIDDEARALLGFAETSLDAQIDPIFQRFEERIPEFGAWAFRWRTSYALLHEGARSAAAWPAGDRKTGFRDSLRRSWDDLVVGQFETLVLEPAGGVGALNEAHRRWWEQVIHATREATLDDLMVVALFQHRPLIAEAAAPVPAAPPEGLDEFRPLEGAPGQLEGRMARPIAARLAFRAPAVATATVVGEAVAGAVDMAVLGGPAGLLATIVGVLGIDYAISRLDEAVSREAFEEDIRRVLHKARADLRERWLGDARAEIERQMNHGRAQLDIPVKAIAATRP
jgi:hypothetical protein